MAPVMLGCARIVQGLSLGGEYGASATYLSEVADEEPDSDGTDATEPTDVDSDDADADADGTDAS